MAEKNILNLALESGPAEVTVRLGRPRRSISSDSSRQPAIQSGRGRTAHSGTRINNSYQRRVAELARLKEKVSQLLIKLALVGRKAGDLRVSGTPLWPS